MGDEMKLAVGFKNDVTNMVNEAVKGFEVVLFGIEEDAKELAKEVEKNSLVSKT